MGIQDDALTSETPVEDTPQGEEVSKEQGDDVGHQKQPESNDSADETPSEDISAKGEDDGGDEPPEEDPDTLESFLEKDDTEIQKVKKYPEVTDEDFSVSDGKYEIHAEHLVNDINKIFGLGDETPDPKLFFSIYKNTPKKADIIAKANGFRSSHYMKAAIEDFVAAEGDRKKQIEILKSDFPDHTWAVDAELPFTVSDKKLTPVSDKDIVKGKYQWAKDDIARAVNDYVADNSKVSKEQILKSAKIGKALGELSGLERNGKPLSAKEALDWAIKMTGLEKEDLSKSKTVSAGGKQKPKTTSKTAKDGVTPGLQYLAKQYGVNL